MTIEIRRAERTKAKLRLGLAGPSGAGKTMSSLKLAKGITPAGRKLMIDTERGSGDLYADLFDSDIITLQTQEEWKRIPFDWTRPAIFAFGPLPFFWALGWVTARRASNRIR